MDIEPNLKPRSYSSSDYAGLQGGEWQFYYGYEETDDDDNWQFVATQNGQERMRYTADDLGASDPWDVEAVLMLGIARYFWLLTA